MKENKYLLCRVDGSLEFVRIRDKCFLQDAYRLIGCDSIEIVQTLISSDIVMILDECGLLCDGWEDRINFPASYCYRGYEHGSPIVGDVIFAHRDGPDLYPLTEYETHLLCYVFDYRGDF